MESDKFKLGLFLILSFIILCFVFVVFGLFDYGQTKVQIITLFEESVQGLETGSTVQLRGVPIGKVKDITISMNDKLIRVDMEIDVNKVRMQALDGAVETELTEASFYQLLRKEIAQGLCAQIQMNGITGGKSIGLDYVEKDVKIVKYAEPGFNSGDVFYMPSRPSMMLDLRNRLLITLDKIASIDYKGLSERTEKLLTSAEALIANPNLAGTLANLDKITNELNTSIKTFNGTITPERLEKITTDTQAAISAATQLVRQMEKSVESAKLGETTAAFRDATTAVTENKRLIKETMSRLGTALDRLSELLQTLEETPSSLIQGKKE